MFDIVFKVFPLYIVINVYMFKKTEDKVTFLV